MKAKIYLLMACAIVSLISCGGGKGSLQEDVVPTVRIDTVRISGMENAQQYPGKVVAAEDANVSFKVAGIIKRVYVRDGQHVRAGQVLAEMDDVDYRVQLSATEAEYAQIKAEAERVIGLYEDGATTASNYDKARYGLQQIEAKLANHRNQLGYTKIYAPYDGYVQKCYFSGGETVAAGMPVISMLSSKVPEIEVNLPASAYGNKDSFCAYECSFDILPGEKMPLQMVGILPKANANQLYTMRLRMLKPEPSIAPGMSTWVTISTCDSLQNEVRVPNTALDYEVEDVYVYTYDAKSEQVSRHSVRVVRVHTDGTCVVEGDLQVGELVVSTGVHHIKNGQKVHLLEPISPTNKGGLL